MDEAHAGAGAVTPEAQELESAIRKASRRLLPFLLLLYIAAFLDRVNIGYVKGPFLRDTGLGEGAFAFGAGIFFVGYAFLEVPSNLMLFRVGARVWIGRIMISWGVVAAAMMLVQGATSFYWLRAALGAMEAGFFPGVIFYLARWFPERQRGPMLGLFYLGAPCAQIIGGPVSGWLLGAEGWWGLHGWQWVFLAEGLIAVVLGGATLLWLTNQPKDARWLTAGERLALQAKLDSETGPIALPTKPASRSEVKRVASLFANATGDKPNALAPTANQARSTLFRSARLWHLGLVYALIQLSVYGVTFYLPTQVGRLLGLNAGVTVGLVSSIPWCFALVSAYLLPRLATKPARTGRVAGIILAAAAVGIFLGSTSNPLLGLAALSLATASFIGVQPIFWTIPTAELSGAQAAAGIALINSFGAVGGFIAPNLRVAAENFWQSPYAGGAALAATTLLGAALAWRLVPAAGTGPMTNQHEENN